MSYGVRLLKQSTKSRARVLEIQTPHGTFLTPQWIPVGTNVPVKTVANTNVPKSTNIVFINSYHCRVTPGLDVIERAGGLHSFFNWHRPLITDSGGFQIYSLKQNDANPGKATELKGNRKSRFNSNLILSSTEQGVVIKSYRDGSRLLLSPEESVSGQHIMGADIILPLDELIAHCVDDATMKASFAKTHRWQKRSLQYHMKHRSNQQWMYGIIHGGSSSQMRRESIRQLIDMPGQWDGWAIGGSLGSALGDTFDIVSGVKQVLDVETPLFPIHLLGIADFNSLHNVVLSGVDTFDSCYITRASRHGTYFYEQGNEVKSLKVGQGKFRYNMDKLPCDCACCQGYSLALLNHLYRIHDTTLGTLLTIHNMALMQNRISRYRRLILNDIL